MGERKVESKHIPWDYDPEKIPRRRRPKNQRIKVRMMLQMSIRCNTCGTYIDKGTKFNSRKEVVIGETYLGIRVFRFYLKCTKCSAELTIKTDPQNSDYVVEFGATRNFEPWRGEEEATEKERKKREAEEMGDVMKSLENRALDSKQDMDILAALEEMKSMKSRHATVSFDEMLATVKRSAYEKEKIIMDEIDESDEEVIKSIIFLGSKDFVRRIQDDENEDLDEDLHQPSSSFSQSSDNNTEGKSTSGLPRVLGKPTNALMKVSIFNSSKDGGTRGGSSLLKPKFIVKRRSVADGPPNKKPCRPERTVNKEPRNDGEEKNDLTSGRSQMTTNGLQYICQNYDSDESE